LWRKPEFAEKTADLSQVTDKLLSHVVSSTHRHERDSNSKLYWGSYDHDHDGPEKENVFVII
jgi:hypothetical protein